MLSAYRREFVDFHTASTREYYLYFSGRKPRYEISEIYSRYSDLFTLDAIDKLKKERETIKKDFETDCVSLDRLILFASENYLGYRVKEMTEEISNLEGKFSIEWEKKIVRFHEIPQLLAKEPDRERRRALEEKRLRLIDSINDLRFERIEKLHDLALKLGYENYLQMYSTLTGVNYAALDNQMQRLLVDTEKIYTIHLEQSLLRNLHVPLSEASRADTFYFARLRSFNDLFPANLLLLAYRETMNGLGIRIDRQRNIEIDIVPRPQKHARAFCAPIVVPNEIKLVLKPMGGLYDYEVFFHEAGHSQHFGFTATDLRPEFKYTGDYALTECYAFLFNYLVSDPEWLKYMLNKNDLPGLPSESLLVKLYWIRRYSAKLHYEISLHSGAQRGKAGDIYKENLSGASKFRYDKAEYLSDLDDGFYTASYLRAWMFEMMFRDYLKTRYGRRWWTSKKAGDLLKEIWNTGNRYTADEMAAQIGLGPLLVEPLEVEFLVGLK
jgi:hypothetical protein